MGLGDVGFEVVGLDVVGLDVVGFGFVLLGVDVELCVGDGVTVACVCVDVRTGAGAAATSVSVDARGVGLGVWGFGALLARGLGVSWSNAGTPWCRDAGPTRAATPAPVLITSRAAAAASTVRVRLGRSGAARSSMPSAPDEGR
ncbi:hypothetical protein [Actinomadura gamaensis]|uniref:Uncharacterized protein n=1 Tax=Actinomadura gamaensis TaxID=1763541 RepID=A0ABV9UBS3_9ACTN